MPRVSLDRYRSLLIDRSYAVRALVDMPARRRTELASPVLLAELPAIARPPANISDRFVLIESTDPLEDRDTLRYARRSCARAADVVRPRRPADARLGVSRAALDALTIESAMPRFGLSLDCLERLTSSPPSTTTCSVPYFSN